MNKKPTVYRRKDSPYWWFSWYAKDGRIRRSGKYIGLTVADYTKEEAERAVLSHLNLAPDPTPAPGRETLTWLTEWIPLRLERDHLHGTTIEKYCEALKDLTGYLGPDFPLADISARPHIPGYKTYLTSRNVRPATINSRLRMLQAIFSRLVDEEIIGRNPFVRFKRVRETDYLTENITREQADILWQTMKEARSQDAVRIFKILAYTGRRAREILELERKDVDLEKGLFRPMNVKMSDQRKRWKEIPEEVKEEFRYFIETKRGNQPFNICRRDTLSKTFLRWRRKAGLPDSLPMKTLRHAFATDSLNEGADPIEVMNYLDHSTFRVTEGYYHPEKVHKLPRKRAIRD